MPLQNDNSTSFGRCCYACDGKGQVFNEEDFKWEECTLCEGTGEFNPLNEKEISEPKNLINNE